ncbi:mannose-1-phosphate guanylyltransferase/mannose-6-phosphate isomerase [Xanthomonadaceae bacterium JHOS43]|nr:mannose-1-phosphate guanylyltransferase/mannose-6-phosphate isomerase [Xanthomonadaceae bacterium JHOS43]
MSLLIPVILSGGAGTRLWPVSRRAFPKPFMRLANGESLLGRTLNRALAVTDGAEVVTVTGTDYRFLTADEYARSTQRDFRSRLLLEPAGRNTAPAIVLAALDIAARHGEDAQLLVLPADHLIDDVDAFECDVAAARLLATQGFLVTFGIVPTAPETGFGYIRAGSAVDGGFVIDAFVEKPDLATAEGYVAAGNYFWNAGMFCFTARDLIAAAAQACPDVLAAARACLAATAQEGDVVTFDKSAFLAQPDISIDYAVMERAGKRAVVPARFDWSDIGSWNALGDLAAADAHGNRVQGEAIVIDGAGNYIQTEGRLVAAVGVKDLVIVDAGDAVLVADRHQVQAVRHVVDTLRQRNHYAAQHHLTVHRPWGSYTVLEDAEDCKVKRLTVKPGGVLSLQRHQRRSEHWTVVQGTAKVRVGDEEMLLQRNQSTYIPMNTLHRLENPGDSDLHLIETQCGDYFGEDDIERLEDVYGRC